MISIVIPAKNEQNNIGPLIREIYQALCNSAICFEVVIVDDGSNDNTYLETLEITTKLNCNARVVRHYKSVGQSTAIYTGVQHAQGNWIITLDADGQNDPADILGMITQAQSVKSPHFCIAGYRKQRKDTHWKRMQSRFANKIRRALLNDGTPDTGCGLKLFPRTTFLQLPYFDHMHRFIPALVRRLNGEILIYEVNHRDRIAGNSNYNAWNRAFVGVIDMLGVMWLQKRTKSVLIEKSEKAA